MRHSYLPLILILVSSVSSGAQGKIEQFTTSKGERYTRRQVDSIERRGNTVVLTQRRESGDTIHYALYFNNRALSPLQRRFLWKPLPRVIIEGLRREGHVENEWSDKLMMIILGRGVSASPRDVVQQLGRLKRDLGDKVYFVGVSPAPRTEVEIFVIKSKFNFAMVPDAENVVDEACGDSDFVTLIVDRGGVVVVAESGLYADDPAKTSGEFRFIMYDRYLEKLNKLLEEKDD